MEHTKHLWRALLLILAVVVLYVVGRAIAVDILFPTFGEYGPYRGESLREEAGFQVRHGDGINSCAPCHEERVETFSTASHSTVNCETCHAPLITHVRFEDLEKFLSEPDSYEWTAEMKIQHAKDLCIRCHESQPAKPAGFPQVIIVDHLEEMGVENSADVCLDCHDPHDPST